MATRNPHSWMWAEACEMLEQAQRLQRQFFRFGHAAEAEPRWEPPIDIQVRVGSGALAVIAVRPRPLNVQTTEVHRLEIPYGRFERRIALPSGSYELLDQACSNGCLILRLARH
jgi:HSP20 family protein